MSNPDPALRIRASSVGAVDLVRVTGILDADTMVRFRVAVGAFLAHTPRVFVLELLDLHIHTTGAPAIDALVVEAAARSICLRLVGDSRATSLAPLFETGRDYPVNDVGGR